MVAKYVWLSFNALVRYKTAGGPLVENKPPKTPESDPEKMPLGVVGLIEILLEKNRKYKLNIIKTEPSKILKISPETFLEKYTATVIVISAEIIIGNTVLKEIFLRYLTVLKLVVPVEINVETVTAQAWEGIK